MFYLILTAVLSTNNNDYDHIGREKQVIELYKQRKSIRDIAKELRMFIRDISILLKKNQVSHGIVITKYKRNDNNNNEPDNNKSPSQETTHACELYNKGKKPVDVAIHLGLPIPLSFTLIITLFSFSCFFEVIIINPSLVNLIALFIKLNRT
jgi:hypothetical protein